MIQPSLKNDHKIWKPFIAGPQIPGLCCNWYGFPADALCNSLRGAPVFLVCGGPSLNQMDLSLLQARGVIIAAVNQVAATHLRPNIWFSVDPPRKFHAAIWRDPAIMKFTRRLQSRDAITLSWEAHKTGWRILQHGEAVRDLPNVWFFEHGHGFTPSDFLTRKRVIWGADYRTPKGTIRTTNNVMLVALRLLYWLGARTVFLVGCDFRMPAGSDSYAFAEPKDARAAGTNNNSYDILNGWFHQLRSDFEKRDYHVINCTPGSRLDAFDRMDFTQAVEQVTDYVPLVRSVRGMYRL